VKYYFKINSVFFNGHANLSQMKKKLVNLE
jgi:hypothetical protein